MKKMVKVPIQLFVDNTLKERLQNIKKHTSIPISKTVSDVLGQHLTEYEKAHGIQGRQQRLDLDEND